MAVFRINKTNDYTVLSNYHLKNKEMSLKAKGLLSLMLSLPDDWDYSILGLVKLSKDGKDVIMKTLNELEEFGYLTRTQSVDERGRFAGYDYDIYETPQTEFPCPEKPNTVNPNTENPTQLNTNILMTNKLNTNIYSNSNGTEPRHRFGVYGRVLLTDKEYNKLCLDLGKDVTDKQIMLVDEYVESNNNKNKYTNFNLVIRKSLRDGWFVKAKPTSSPKPTRERITDYDDLV